MMRVALYCRVSTEEQAAHGLSIEAQRAALEEWADGMTVAGRYIDAGISARKPASKRPELQRLLRDIEAGKIDLVAFTKLDRWFRNIAEYYKVQEVLDAHNVAWKAIHEDYETQTAAGRLKVNIMLAVAQDEADRTSERIKAVFAEKRARGEAVSGKTAYGVELADKKLRPDGNAEKVKEIFDYYISSRSIRQTMIYARELTGQTFSYMVVSWMLSNPVYAELGIITPEVWDSAKRLRAANSPRTPKSGKIYLFQGLIFCAECGGSMGAHCNGQYKKYAYYYCRRKIQEAICANGKTISERKIEKQLLLNILDKCQSVNMEIKHRRRKTVDAAAIRRKLDKLTDLYISDLITREKYESEYRAAQEAIQRAEEQPKPIDIERVRGALSAYQGLTDEGKRAFWGRIIRRIEIDREGVVSFDLNVIL